MKGIKTYCGIFISFLGFLGLGDFFTNEEAGQFLDLALQLGGLIYATYGRYKATRH